jgi:hypothetical protein
VKTALFTFALLAGANFIASAARAQESGIRRGIASSVNVVGTGSSVLFPFNTTAFSSGLTATGGNLGTASTSGIYTVAGGLTFSSSSNAPVFGEVVVNGSQVVDRFYVQPTTNAWTDVAFSTLAPLTAGDVVSLRLGAQTGNVQVAAAEYTQASMNAVTGGVSRRLASTVNIPSGTTSVVPFANTVVNSPGFSATGSNVGTVSTSGIYTVAGSLTFSSSSNGPVFGEVVVNGSQVVDSFYVNPTSNAFTDVAFSTIAALNPGDSVTLRVGAQGGNVQIASAEYTQASINTVSSGILRGIASSVNFVGTGSSVLFPFDTTVFSSPGLTATGGNLGTVLTSGIYTVAGGLTFSSSSNAPVFGEVVVNGSQVVDRFYLQPTANAWTDVAFSTLTPLTAGDVVSLRLGALAGNVQVAPSSFTRASMSQATAVPESSRIPFVAAMAVVAAYGCRRLIRTSALMTNAVMNSSD